ncbi:hypothetical protein [Caulobacter sp. Root655]|nr:hypothetical protein [Caulobacter sp. Root655]
MREPRGAEKLGGERLAGREHHGAQAKSCAKDETAAIDVQNHDEVLD